MTDTFSEGLESMSETLHCSEVLEESPITNPSTGSTNLSPRKPKNVFTDSDDNLHGDRGLAHKLLEQTIPTDVVCWGSSISVRTQNWMYAYDFYRRNGFSQASLQLGISLLDRFVKNFRVQYDGDIGAAPLDSLFDAALIIVEQLLDDAPQDTLVPLFQNKPTRNSTDPANLQLAVQMILEVTQWEVIDWTPASFIPHFLEETQLRQYGASGTHEEVLALSTLFMIDEKISSRVPPSAIAALAIVLHSWLVGKRHGVTEKDNKRRRNTVVLPPEDTGKIVGALLRAGNMTAEYFAKMSDFAVTCLVGGRLYAGLNARSARKFVARVKSVCGRSVSQL